MKFFILLASVLSFSQMLRAETGASFDVTMHPMGDFVGKVSEVTGFAVLDGKKVSAENVKVKLSGLKTGMETRDGHAKKYLEVEKFPEAILVKAHGENGKGSGVLKIHGIENKIEGTYKIEGSELIADWHIKLSEYGITGIRYKNLGVDDEVVVHVTLPVQKKK